MMMNVIYCINKLRWLLYTLMIQDKKESWVFETHMLTAEKNSDIVMTELLQISVSYYLHLY